MRLTSFAKSRLRGLIRREKGSQMVELAIALPVILVLLASLAEFANFFYTYSTLTNAVRAGARHASKWRVNEPWEFPETSNMVVYGDFSDTSHGPTFAAALTFHAG